MKLKISLRRSGQLLPASFLCVLVVCSSNAQLRPVSQSQPLSQPAYWTPTNLAHHVAAADRVLATNWFASWHGDPGLGRSFSGRKVREIVAAVSSARRYPNWNPTSSIYDWELQFYNGTNRLDAIHFQGRVFLLADGEYVDDTGVLEKVYDDLSTWEYASRVYKDEDKEFAAAQDKAEARGWLKAPTHTLEREKRKKVIGFVNDFYTASAARVFIADIRKQGRAETEIAKTMVVVLPQDPAARRRVFAVARRAPAEWMNDPDPDVGQKYLWYVFE